MNKRFNFAITIGILGALYMIYETWFWFRKFGLDVMDWPIH